MLLRGLRMTVLERSRLRHVSTSSVNVCWIKTRFLQIKRFCRVYEAAFRHTLANHACRSRGAPGGIDTRRVAFSAVIDTFNAWLDDGANTPDSLRSQLLVLRQLDPE